MCGLLRLENESVSVYVDSKNKCSCKVQHCLNLVLEHVLEIPLVRRCNSQGCLNDVNNIDW